MPDRTHKAADNIPIDTAIAFMVSTFKFVCHDFKESSTVPKISFTVLIKLLPSLATTLKPLTQLLSLSKIVVIMPPFTRSKRDFISPF